MTPVLVRPARAADASDLAVLAALDSAAPLTGDVLLAVSGGEVAAAMSLDTGAVVADPFVPTTPPGRAAAHRRPPHPAPPRPPDRAAAAPPPHRLVLPRSPSSRPEVPLAQRDLRPLQVEPRALARAARAARR